VVSVTDVRLDRLGVQLGELLEEHTVGLGILAPECTRFADDPVGFDHWAEREPEIFQEDIMYAVHAQRYTAVAGANGVGKDWLLGSLAVWAAFARRMLVLVISATEKQALGQSMREVYAAWKAHEAAGHLLGGQFFRGSLRVGGEDRIIALTGGSSIDALTGWHDPAGVLVLVSESQAEPVERSVYASFDAVTTNANSRILVQGNPTRPGGAFWDVHQRKSWKRFSISVFNTPNCVAGKMVHPAFPAPDWPAVMAQEHGADSPWFTSRVKGQFPTSAEDALVRLELLEAAAGEERVEELTAGVVHAGPQRADWRGHTKPVVNAVLGADIAREGADMTAVVVRRGPVVWELHRWREADVIEGARRIAALVRRLCEMDGFGCSHVVIDETSMGGGTHDELKRLLRDVSWREAVIGLARSYLIDRTPRLIGFKSSRRAPQPERFVDTRAQSFWHLRDEFERGRIAFRKQLDRGLLAALREELAAHSFFYEGDDRLRVGQKDDVKKKIGRSPDLADALAMSYEPALEKSGRKTVKWA